MIKGINTAASGMISTIDLNNIIANNLANINTPGFKQLIPTFKSVHDACINEKINENSNPNNAATIGKISIGSAIDATQLDFSQGALKKTGGSMDVALNSNGFFVIQAQSREECYTRNGSFTLNEDGNLITRAGDIVIGEGGRAINIDPGTNNLNAVTIMADGRITLNDEEVNRIKVVDFKDLSKLKMKGNTLFENIDKDNKPVELENYTVTQGYLETSNANVIKSMINSITGERTYEALSQVIRNTNSTLKKAVNDVGRVR